MQTIWILPHICSPVGITCAYSKQTTTISSLQTTFKYSFSISHPFLHRIQLHFLCSSYGCTVCSQRVNMRTLSCNAACGYRLSDKCVQILQNGFNQYFLRAQRRDALFHDILKQHQGLMVFPKGQFSIVEASVVL